MAPLMCGFDSLFQKLQDESARKSLFLRFLHLHEGQESSEHRERESAQTEAECTCLEVQSLKEALASARSEADSAHAEAEGAKKEVAEVEHAHLEG